MAYLLGILVLVALLAVSAKGYQVSVRSANAAGAGRSPVER